MKIYMVEFHNYDLDDCVGYFTDPQKAKECCTYLNRVRPNYYDDNNEWHVVEYDPDEKDYESLNKELDEKERIEFEGRMERIKQEELKELARLKAKYGEV